MPLTPQFIPGLKEVATLLEEGRDMYFGAEIYTSPFFALALVTAPRDLAHMVLRFTRRRGLREAEEFVRWAGRTMRGNVDPNDPFNFANSLVDDYLLLHPTHGPREDLFLTILCAIILYW